MRTARGCARRPRRPSRPTAPSMRPRTMATSPRPKSSSASAGQAVAARAARLLVVALDGLGQVVVHDEAHVGLVDAHAEGDGGDDDVDLVAREGVLYARALVRRQAGVVGGGAARRPAAAVGDLLDALAREAVDDAGLALVLRGRNGEQLLQRLALLDHGVADVGPVEAGDVHGGVGQTEPAAHVVARLGVGRGRAGHERHVGEAGRAAARAATYSGRKSWPHCETQCASSMANRARPCSRPCSRSRKPSVMSVSGAT